jgi:predicted enzyme related to lactoylglutathione lyase
MTTQLGAVTLIVPDYDEAITFFTTVLNFALTADQDQGHKRWVTVTGQQGGSAFVLARAEGEEQTAMIGRQGAGRVWLFLQSDDFETDRTRMEAAGVVFEEPTRHEPYGKVAVWRDPWGNRWDLLQPN